MNKIKFLLTALLISSAVFVHAQTTLTASSVTYMVKNLGIETNGKFGGLDANIKFDPAQPAAGSIEASIDATTVNSNNDTRDKHLKGEKFFDVEHYPRILLKSTSIEHKKSNNFLGKFNLTIKGKTKPVDVPFTYTETNGKVTYAGSFKLNRKDFNVGGSSMVLADEVTVFISAETIK
jgi:polyisoprenoid-binding protein YceI